MVQTKKILNITIFNRVVFIAKVINLQVRRGFYFKFWVWVTVMLCKAKSFLSTAHTAHLQLIHLSSFWAYCILIILKVDLSFRSAFRASPPVRHYVYSFLFVSASLFSIPLAYRIFEFVGTEKVFVDKFKSFQDKKL